MISAVLFDLDGTLADTAPDMAHTVNEMRSRRGLAPVDPSVVRPFVSKGARGMIQAAFGVDSADPQYAAMREEFLAIYEKHLKTDSRLFPGMVELLEWLEAEGLAWGVVTNKFARFANPIVDHLCEAGRCAIVVGGDTCGRAKPHPDPLLHAARALGVAPAETLYVGDDERDVQAARAAGMPVLVAGYGYLGDGAPPETWGSDGIVGDPAGIRAWIRAKAREAA